MTTAQSSVGSSTHCDPSALFILGVYTVRISNIELHTVRAITNRTGSISSAVCQYIFTHGVHWDTLSSSVGNSACHTRSALFTLRSARSAY
jgi:hypothetical protein